MGVKACPEQRKCKLVYWLPERGKWIVKCRRLSSSGLHALTQDRAAKLAADALGCTVQSLRLLSRGLIPEPQPPRHVRNVCWDSVRRKWRIRQVLRQPRFASEQEAARVAAQLTKVHLTTLRLPCPKRTKRDTIDDLRCRWT